MKRAILPACAFVAAFSAGTLFTSDPMPPSSAVPLSRAASARAVEPAESPAFAAVSAAARRLGQNPDLGDFAAVASHLEQLDATQLSALMDLMEKSEEHPTSLFSWWLKRDPAAASAWMQSRLRRFLQDGPLGMTFENGAGQFVSVWVRALPQEAIDFARRNPESDLSTFLLTTALRRQWSKDRDFAGAQAMLMNFPAGPAREAGIKLNIEGWAQNDPAAALATARALSDESERHRMITAVLQSWPRADVATAVERYRELDLHNPELLSGLLRKAASKDPAAALRLLDQLDPQEAAHVAPDIIHAWAGKDPVAALQWAIDHGFSLAPRYYSVVDGRIDHNSLGRQSSFGGGNSVNPLKEAVTANTAATLQWIRSLPADDRMRLSELALPHLKLAQQRELFPELSPGAQMRAAGTIIRATTDPAEARKWIESLPAGTMRENAWLAYGQTQSTLADIPPGPERDAMIHGRALGSGIREAETDLGLVLQISDPQRQRDAFDEVMEFYIESIPNQSERARKWMEESSFPEEWKRAWRLPKAASTPH